MNVKIPNFNTKKEMFDFIVSNKSILITDKKCKLKVCDTVTYNNIKSVEKKFAIKTAQNGMCKDCNQEPCVCEVEEVESLVVTSVINTTNIIDSHDDVHIKGIWNKSLKENKNIYLLQEHDMSFKGIIADNVNAYVSDMDWSALGYNSFGKTQALIFESNIYEDRNKFMFEQYLNGYVKNHSVGMQYVSLYLCVNDKDYKEEFANWNKYIAEVVNRTDAEDNGFFWAITEAKVIEGSAVVVGSNPITPTLETIEITEPVNATPKSIVKPDDSTLQKENVINSINNFKFV